MTHWIVVGAGAAGCVVAGRLAEGHRSHRVTLIEAGAGAIPDAMRGSSFFDALATPGRTFAGSFQRGRGLGGSATVNGMIATAGDPAQYAGWGWDDAPAALARVRQRMPAAPARPDELGVLDRALLDAAPDATVVPLNRRAGRRVTPADAYLEGVDTARLTVRSDAFVTAVELAGRRAIGVRLAGGDVVAGDRVVVTAGAVGTPTLLLRSGVDTPGIGSGLQNHPGLPIVLRLHTGASAPIDGLVTASALCRGPIQLLPLNHLGPEAPGMAMLLVVLMTPTGAGHVTIPGNAASEEEVVVDHSLPPADRAGLARGVLVAQRLLDHPSIAALLADVETGEAPAGIFHPTSTCAMGTVVDDDGAVRGYERLYVADASAFPAIPTTNTYLPTLMLAERLVSRLGALTS